MNEISRKARLIGRLLKRNHGYVVSAWPGGMKELYVRSVDDGYAVGEQSHNGDEDGDWETVYEDPYEAADAFEEIEAQRLAGL